MTISLNREKDPIRLSCASGGHFDGQNVLFGRILKISIYMENEPAIQENVSGVVLGVRMFQPETNDDQTEYGKGFCRSCS